MSAALLDHLWQSTLFALCAWLLTLALRAQGAHLRHAVWLAASVKFLVPFSLLVMMGRGLQQLAGVDAPVVHAPDEDAVATLLTTPGRVLVAEAADSHWLSVMAAVWLIGFAALVARWFLRWRRVQALLRKAEPLAMAVPVPVRAAPGLREPGVVGIVRPVLLLPANITSQLTPEQLEAILRHELCHVRRHDNLTSALHMFVEAVFWFHPMVWWIGARLLDEREHACDESVVRSGSDRGVYAEGILRICRSCLSSDLACVAGVSGADLKLRMEAIMTKEVKELGIGGRVVLAAVALAAVATPVVVGLVTPASARAAEARAAANPVARIELLAGKRVKLQYQDVDVRGLIRAMGEAASVNILVSDKVSGTVTVKLEEMPWDQAFAIILNSQGLVKREKDGILFIEPASA